MNGTNNLDPFSTKPRETRMNPQNQIGGTFEYLDFELPNPQKVISEGKSFLGEAISSISDLVNEDIVGKVESKNGGMPTQGSIEFQNSVAKTPEALEREKEAQFKREVYTAQEKTIRDVERLDREKAVEELVRLEVAGMGGEERNKELGFNLDYNENNTNTAYHIHALRERKKEQLKAMEIQAQDTNKLHGGAKNFMGEGELLKGGENPNHFTRAAG